MPERPVRINQDVRALQLHQEGGVTQPGDADFVILRIRHRPHFMARLARGQQRGDQHITQELQIALAPALGGQQAHMVFALGEVPVKETPHTRPGTVVTVGGPGKRVGFVDHGDAVVLYDT